MGERKHKGVVVIIGLLFIMIVVNILVFHRLSEAIAIKEQGAIGSLLLEHPAMELELIKAFEKDQWEESNSEVLEGKALESKYGYESSKRQSSKVIGSFKGYILWTIALLGFFIVLIYIYDEKRKNKSYEKDLRNISSFLDAYLHNNFQVPVEDDEGNTLYSSVKYQLRDLGQHLALLNEKMLTEEKETKALVTDISHQLKTPLASLKMSYEIASTDTFSQEERNSFFIQGREEIKKLESLLEALINVSRLETNMIQIKPVASSLKGTLIKSVNSIYMKAFHKEIEIAMDEFQDINILHDPKWTQEAFVNVLDNAIKYSPPHSKIEIHVSIMISYALIEIEDEGIGISPKEYPSIFKRFYRGHSKTVENTEGSGVGLYLARTILEEQGGSIRVKPGLKKGSIFQISLPISS